MTRNYDATLLNINRLQNQIWDDFQWYVTAHLWADTLTGAGSPTNAVGNGAGGILVQTTGTTAQDSNIVSTKNKIFAFANNKPAYFECNYQYAEANTNTAGLAFGFCSAPAATVPLPDSVANVAVAASWSGALIYKRSGELFWRCVCSNGTTLIETLTNVATGGAAAATFGIEFKPYSSTNAHVIYTFNGAIMRDSNGVPIKHEFVYTGSAALTAMVEIKYVSGGVTEVGSLDYVYAGQLR